MRARRCSDSTRRRRRRRAVAGASLLFVVAHYLATDAATSIIAPRKAAGVEPAAAAPPPPAWSASALARRRRRPGGPGGPREEEDAAVAWRRVGMNLRAPELRHATELVAFGLGSLMPYYGDILPALRIVDDGRPGGRFPETEIAAIPDLVDATLDLHECRTGRIEWNANGTSGRLVRDGRYNACLPTGEDAGRDAAKALCYEAGRVRGASSRIRAHPSPGHELWPCSDPGVMGQLVAAHVLDYLTGHADRFYRDRTNNLFFFRDRPPARLASVDHDCVTPYRLLDGAGYGDSFELEMLRDHVPPRGLEDDVRRVRLLGSGEDFARDFNSSVYGELGRIRTLLVRTWSDPRFDRYGRPGENRALSHEVTDVLWDRLASVAEFYNITAEGR